MAGLSTETQVVVVGAGPVGLMLAGELRLGGAEVVVLDDRPGPTTESRASTLHARTMEILDARGLLDELGTPADEPRGHFGGVPMSLTLPSTHPGQWKVSQTRTEELLQRWATGLGADIRRGYTLRELAVGEEGVEAVADGPGGPLRVRGSHLVGCDGERSTVRRLIGAPFPGQDAGREMLRADVRGIDIPDRRFQRLAGGLAVAATREGVTRVMVHEFGAAVPARTGEPRFEEVVDVWKRVTGEDISGGTPLWVNSFGDANRQLARYRHGRILFAGDAAHQQMPIGGQALNLGLQDAFNLGWKLAAEVTGRASAGLLDSYHTERHDIGRRVLANIRAQAGLLLGRPEVEPVRALLAELLTLDDVREHLAGKISGLDVRYDVGHDGGAPDAGPALHLLGRRLPPVHVTTAQGELHTAVLLRGGRGVLLDLGVTGEDGTPEDVVAGWADRVTLTTARATDDGLPAGTALLVRPDGHVVWAGPRRAGATDALRRWFGEPVRN
ncbi:FAD-dependent monooxygenase [Streptomyces sp. P9(2023)]|uniref:FAD-dependent monooxygenase n=1 Tax=Streptomyces sp. P9(2023) TaxID=3064394 RepID=UPI0028F43979|nr:FAD-dependent monooxygenase [Streptomyces sp. P9(2023)]MDT9693701.1 FAD-dependent monooxygenase [Streptomyces sp. P9(2023)]